MGTIVRGAGFVNDNTGAGQMWRPKLSEFFDKSHAMFQPSQHGWTAYVGNFTGCSGLPHKAWIWGFDEDVMTSQIILSHPVSHFIRNVTDVLQLFTEVYIAHYVFSKVRGFTRNSIVSILLLLVIVIVVKYLRDYAVPHIVTFIQETISA
jgi:hypothetical protein